MAPHTSAGRTSRTSRPSIRTCPPVDVEQPRARGRAAVVLPLPVEPTIAVVSPGRATRSTSLEHGVLGTGVRERRALRRRRDPATRSTLGTSGSQVDRRLGVEHLGDALGRHLRPRPQHEHEGRHHDGHQGLDQVLLEGRQLPICERRRRRSAVRPEPQRRGRPRAFMMPHEHAGRSSPSAGRRPIGDLAVRWLRLGEARGLVRSSRTKARITRMPVICSRMIWLMVSIRTCMSRNSGRIRRMISPSDDRPAPGARSGTRPTAATSWRSAMTMPPMHMIGAATSIVRPMNSEQLDLLDVVGVAGDQRRRRRTCHLAAAERLDLREDRGAQVASERHRRRARRSRRRRSCRRPGAP